MVVGWEQGLDFGAKQTWFLKQLLDLPEPLICKIGVTVPTL